MSTPHQPGIGMASGAGTTPGSGNYLRGDGLYATIDAADIASGLIDPARLGTGTADATTVLYGDGTWAAPGGGGGGGGLTHPQIMARGVFGGPF